MLCRIREDRRRSLKIDLESIFKGGNFKSRNPRIQKMFSLIELGEGARSRFSKILSAWNEQSWRIPELFQIE